MTLEIVRTFLVNHWLEIILWGTAVGLIPLLVRKRQEAEKRQLAEDLLRTWISYCIDAIIRLKPDKIGKIEVKDYWPKTKISPHGPIDLNTIETQIQVGHIDLSGFNHAIYETLKQLIGEDDYNVKYTPYKPEIVKARVRAILNQMYAKAEIFNVSATPVMTLELALGNLEEVTSTGSCSFEQFERFAMNMAYSM